MREETAREFLERIQAAHTRPLRLPEQCGLRRGPVRFAQHEWQGGPSWRRTRSTKDMTPEDCVTCWPEPCVCNGPRPPEGKRVTLSRPSPRTEQEAP